MPVLRLPRYSILVFVAVPLILLSPLPSVAAGTSGSATIGSGGGTPVATPLPAGGTVTEIDAQVQTNLVVLSTGATIPLSVLSARHTRCVSQTPVVDASGHQEFTNSFQFLQATFNQTPIGPVVIMKNPKLPINGLHTAASAQAVFPVHSKVWLYLQVSAMGMTLVNRDPIVLEADINAWPQVGAVYQATTGNIDFFSQDVDGNPTGPAVAQLYGTQVTITAGQTVAPTEEDQPGSSAPNNAPSL
ncbi:MAG: hypothetical protein WAM82_11215 [Thermoanaerobaculia bacterium]